MRHFFVRITIVLSILLMLFPFIGQPVKAMPISAQSAILMEQASGRVLFEKDAHEQMPIASITKIMTAIIAIENGDLEEEVKASKEAVYTTGSSIYLQEDEEMSLEDLLYGLMLRSGNDAAVAIAEHIGGSEEGFVLLMNETARYLGMTNTHFKNAHGLHEDGHYASAYDMAILMRYAMENEIFKEISRTKSYLSDKRTYHWHNKNKLLTTYADFSTGGKTGYTRKAGRTLVTTAAQDDLELISVTLNASDDWNDHRYMFEWGFEHYDLTMLEPNGERVFQVEDEEMTGYIKYDTVYPLSEEERPHLTRHVYLLKQPSDNEVIGNIVYELDGESILEVPIYKLADVSNEGMFSRMVKVLKRVMGLDQHG